MRTDKIKSIAGTVGNIRVSSRHLSFFELQSLVCKAAAMEQGRVTIIVHPDTLRDDEIAKLAHEGGMYVELVLPLGD